MKKLNLITSNAGKINSFKDYSKTLNLNVDICAQNLNLMEPQADTVKEVSLFKAQTAYNILKEPVVIEDGGMIIPSLKGFPGVYTKYIIQTIGADGILALMHNKTDRIATFNSVTTYIDEHGKAFQFESKTGTYLIAQQKTNIMPDFAWSELWQILTIPSLNKTLSELSEEEYHEYLATSTTVSSVKIFLDWYATQQ